MRIDILITIVLYQRLSITIDYTVRVFTVFGYTVGANIRLRMCRCNMLGDHR